MRRVGTDAGLESPDGKQPDQSAPPKGVDPGQRPAAPDAERASGDRVGGGAGVGGIRIEVKGRILTLQEFANAVSEAAAKGAMIGMRETAEEALQQVKLAQEVANRAGNPNALVMETEVMIDGIESFHRAALAVGIRSKCGHAAKVVFEQSPWTVDKHQATLSELATRMQAEAAIHPCPLCAFAAEKGGDA